MDLSMPSPGAGARLRQNERRILPVLVLRRSVNMQDNCLPNLFIPGAARSGTSSLYDYLSRHPDICMSANKEPSYFCRTDRTLHDYDALYSKCKHRTYRGDASTSYMVRPEVARKIRDLVVGPKFVFILRNPVDRAWSHYWWVKGNYGLENDKFRVAFQREMHKEPEPEYVIKTINNLYYQFGRYSKWINEYYNLFDKKDIHIVIFEDLVSNPERALDGIYEFLGVKKITLEKNMQSNPGGIVKYPILPRMHAVITTAVGSTVGLILPSRLKYELILLNRKLLFWALPFLSVGNRPAMSHGERKWVSSFYREDVGSLRKMTGMEFGQWNDDFGL